MNYFKAAEQVLDSISALKSALQNLERRKELLIQKGTPSGIGSIDYSKPFTKTSYASDTLNDLLELSECQKNIEKTKSEINYIESVIIQLSEEYRKVIELWYIKKQTKEQISEALFFESTTSVYNLRNRAVAEFALLYYGAAALSSI